LSAGDFFEYVVCLGGPDEWLWGVVVAVDVVADGHDELFEILEDSAPNAVFGQVAEEALDHVQPRSRSWREVHVEAFMASHPALHPFMFVGCVIVADDVDLLFARDGLVDQAQELQPLVMTVALLAQVVDLAGGGVESGEQHGCAIALVIVRHGLAAPLLEGKTGLSAVQRLNLALLVDRQNQRVLGQVEIESDNVLQLGSEIRIVADLEAFNTMRL